jgi:hypothetical protein
MLLAARNHKSENNVNQRATRARKKVISNWMCASMIQRLGPNFLFVLPLQYDEEYNQQSFHLQV